MKRYIKNSYNLQDIRHEINGMVRNGATLRDVQDRLDGLEIEVGLTSDDYTNLVDYAMSVATI